MSRAVLFVCLGNICRSPTAEGVFRARLQQAGMADQVRVDSAGTADWHRGKGPDPRTVAAAARRGIDLASLRARPVTVADFEHFDLILAMDQDNLAVLRRLCPPDWPGTLDLFLRFHPGPAPEAVPDPYHGDADGFETVLDLVEAACDGLLDHLHREQA